MPGYATAFPMGERTEYALPGEVPFQPRKPETVGCIDHVETLITNVTKEPRNRQKPRDPGDGQGNCTRAPSFTDLLPWVEYDPRAGAFLLEDGITLGALFELTPAGTEARTPEFMTQLRDAIQTALTDAIPEEDDAPGCCRSTCRTNQPAGAERDRRLPTTERRDAIHPALSGDVWPRHPCPDHRPGGLFEDKAVTGTHWRGQLRRVRGALSPMKPGQLPSAIEVEGAERCRDQMGCRAGLGRDPRGGEPEKTSTSGFPNGSTRPSDCRRRSRQPVEIAPIPG